MRRWRTAERPVAEQFSYWREVVCAAFTELRPTARGTSCDRWDRPGVRGWVDSLAYGTVNGAEVGSCDQVIRHGAREVSRLVSEVVFVNLQLRGRCLVRQDDRSCLSGPGTFSIVDATREFQLDYLDDWRAVSFRIPAERLQDLASPERARTAVTFDSDSGLSRVLADTMRSLWGAAPELDEASAVVGGDVLAALAGAVLRGGPTAQIMGRSEGDEALRRSVRQFVAANLEYADVSPGAVARQFGISVRKLHLLYSGEPRTFGQTVMGLRAAKCAEHLRDRAWPGTLTELAARWGFSDLSHMNRVFRREFGCLPSEYRTTAHQQAVSSMTTAPPLRGLPADGAPYDLGPHVLRRG
ncbi:helix-turn-helix domain-containing protein [Streptomyces sp. NPDC001833]|uniref:AraC-like ligand-binding domain-containing protein n=1 Tax=Streptomyces sp. NPDC001833 TaxID=3154658 RepID=UPI0033286D9C